MKNQAMWFTAIGINFILIFLLVYPNVNSNQRGMEIKVFFLLMPFIISAINFCIAIFINTYNAVKGEKFSGHPFFLLSLLALLVGLGICALQK